MKLIMDAVKAIEWTGDNFGAVSEFLSPFSMFTLSVVGTRLLLVQEGVNKVFWIDKGEWLTRPEVLEQSPTIFDVREGEGFRSKAVCILYFSQIKAEFRIELDETDDEVCTTCHNRLFEHTVLVGGGLGVSERGGITYACPPDPANEIDTELTKLDAVQPPDRENAEEFKKRVFARVAPQPDPEAQAKFDEVLKGIEPVAAYPDEPENESLTKALEVSEEKTEDAAAAMLEAQNDWRGV